MKYEHLFTLEIMNQHELARELSELRVPFNRFRHHENWGFLTPIEAYSRSRNQTYSRQKGSRKVDSGHNVVLDDSRQPVDLVNYQRAPTSPCATRRIIALSDGRSADFADSPASMNSSATFHPRSEQNLKQASRCAGIE